MINLIASAPARIQASIRQIREILSQSPTPDRFPHLKPSERKRITEIFKKTLPAWKKF